MATFKEFEEIECWKRARELTRQVRCQLYVASDQGYIQESEFGEPNALAVETGSMVGGLMRYLRGSGYKGTKFKPVAQK